MAIGPQANQRQKILIIVFVVILLLATSVLLRRFSGAPSGESLTPSFPPIFEGTTPTIPFDLFDSDNFLDLQTYKPITAPNSSRRENPFE